MVTFDSFWQALGVGYAGYASQDTVCVRTMGKDFVLGWDEEQNDLDDND